MTPTAKPAHAPLPYGVRDLFFDEAATHAALCSTWRSLFVTWGYTEVVTPTYEHYDVLLRGYGADQEAGLYRVLDREGEVLALRPDVTTQVARLAGTKLANEPRPLRFCYVTNVFRYDEPQAGRQREFFQAGVELIGARTAEADAEVIELAVESMTAVGLAGFQLNLGHMGLFRGLIAALALRPGQAAGLRRAVDRKDGATLSRLLTEYQVEPGCAALLKALPKLCGGRETLEAARELLGTAAGAGVSADAQSAIDHLERLYLLLTQSGVAGKVILDLGEVRGMGYYTGINFEGFAEGIAFPICSGGRYDDLVGLYGAPSPAVGFALGVERVQMALARQGAPAASSAPDLLASAGAAARAADALRLVRASKLRVAVDPALATDDALCTQARQLGIRQVLLDGGDEAVLVSGGQERRVPWQNLEEALGR